MVVNNLDDADGGHTAFVNPARRQLRKRIVVGLENESRCSSQVERVLPTAVAGERVETPGRPADVGERRCRLEHGQSPPDDRPLLAAEAADPCAVGLAILGQLPVGPIDVDRMIPLDMITPGVIMR